MGNVRGISFEPETIELLRAVLDEAFTKLPERLRTSSVKVELAELILKSAAGGERDPARLRSAAIIGIAGRHRPTPSDQGIGSNLLYDDA